MYAAMKPQNKPNASALTPTISSVRLKNGCVVVFRADGAGSGGSGRADAGPISISLRIVVLCWATTWVRGNPDICRRACSNAKETVQIYRDNRHQLEKWMGL